MEHVTLTTARDACLKALEQKARECEPIPNTANIICLEVAIAVR
jgi:hypothetical protein